MAKQPLLPGFTFESTQGKSFHLAQNFNVINGFNVPKLNLDNFSNSEFEPFFSLNQEFQPYNVKNDYIKYDPLEEYTNYKKPVRKFFAPQYVLHDGKCLSFQGYFKQEVPEHCRERILNRKVNIIYYLEDDTMTIIEPPIPNSGYPQGRLVRRGKIPKPKSSECWHWKNLNVGIDIEAYGIVYHLSSCDRFTKEYLLSRGIEVNENEEIPSNILHNDTNHRKYTSYNYGVHEEQTPFSQDKLYRFLQYDRKVLRFYAFWSEKDDLNECSDIKRYKIYYYLIDDTVEIRESPTRFSHNELFKRLLRRTKLSKSYESGPVSNLGIGSSHRKTTDQEYYQPSDFLIGTYIYILGRKFFIYDCDDFTRTYYKEYLKIEQPTSINIPEKHAQPLIRVIPPHTGIGQPEDTLQSCLSIIPKPPRKDVIHYVENTNKYLRYSAKLDSNIEDDKEREFIIQYLLSDGKISIYEVKVQNSGFTPGYFLKSALVPKISSSSTNNYKPEYYTPDDFVIGRSVNIFGRKFLITGADLAVLRYMESNSQSFEPEAVKSVREYMKRKGIISDIDDKSENLSIDVN